MKKGILFFMGFLFAMVMNAQNPVEFSKVIKYEGVSADEAFSKVELWLVNAFKAPDKTVQLNDPVKKRLAVKAATEFHSKKKNVGDINGFLTYTLNIFFRDGRLKVEMHTIVHHGKKEMYDFGQLTDAVVPDVKIAFATKKWKSEIYTEMKKKAEYEFNDICRMIEDNANNKTAAEEDDW